MSSTTRSRYLARLQRLCDLSIVPALLLLAACGGLVLMIVLAALQTP